MQILNFGVLDNPTSKMNNANHITLIFFPDVIKSCSNLYVKKLSNNFGRVFLMLNYTDITQNTYIQS